MANSDDERRGRGDRRVTDRRKGSDPAYTGPERRQGDRRRGKDRRQGHV
jgi:hypothetical protein